MSKATVSVVLVLPRSRGRLQCVTGLEPATRAQQLDLQGRVGSATRRRANGGWPLPFGPLRRIFVR